MPRPPSKSLTSTVASPPRPPALSEALRDRSGPRCFGPPLFSTMTIGRLR